MKKLLIIAFVISLGRVGAQNEEEKWNVGVHGGMTQYNGDLGNGWYSTNQAAYGLVGLSLSRYLTERFDASLFLTRGEAGHQAPRDFSMSEDVLFNYRVSLTTANLLARYHLRDRETRLNPYVFGGLSYIRQEGFGGQHLNRRKFEYSLPTGGFGFHYRFNPVVSFQFQETFMYTSSDDIDYRVKGMNDAYLLHSIGFTFNLEKRQMFEASGPSRKLDKCPRMKTGTQMKRGEGKGKLKPRKKAKNTFI
jgi:OmpA-OmpF porin, OOP family